MRSSQAVIGLIAIISIAIVPLRAHANSSVPQACYCGGHCPPDILRFSEREGVCSIPALAAHLARDRPDLRCGDVEPDRASLKLRYHTNAAVLSMLSLPSSTCVVKIGFVGIAQYKNEHERIICRNGNGLGAMVPNGDTARAIYLAVARGRGDKVTKQVKVEDAGAHWSVFQLDVPPVSGNGTLEMEIDKCSGTIRAYATQ
jgi:hypothetical protein